MIDHWWCDQANLEVGIELTSITAASWQLQKELFGSSESDILQWIKDYLTYLEAKHRKEKNEETIIFSPCGCLEVTDRLLSNNRLLAFCRQQLVTYIFIKRQFSIDFWNWMLENLELFQISKKFERCKVGNMYIVYWILNVGYHRKIW